MFVIFIEFIWSVGVDVFEFDCYCWVYEFFFIRCFCFVLFFDVLVKVFYARFIRFFFVFFVLFGDFVVASYDLFVCVVVGGGEIFEWVFFFVVCWIDEREFENNWIWFVIGDFFVRD